MSKEVHICCKCHKEEPITTFFAHKINLNEETGEYDIDPEWICTDCMTNMMASLVATKEIDHADLSIWFPLHKRISLEFEDEDWGSFTIKVWHAEELRVATHPLPLDLHTVRLNTTGRHVFIFEGTNLTYDESAHFSAIPTSFNIPQFIKAGMDRAIQAAYDLVKAEKSAKQK